MLIVSRSGLLFVSRSRDSKLGHDRTEQSMYTIVTDDSLPRTARGRPGASLVIPAYNEEASITSVVDKAREVLQACADRFEIIVVDDGSADRTGELAEQAGARVVSHPYNRGYGNSLKSGISAARYEDIVICDADQSYPLDELPRLLQDADRYDMIVGARQGAQFHGSFFKRIGRW